MYIGGDILNVGENIKKYRKNSNLTQKQLAEKIGVTVVTIQNYENSRREPSFEVLCKMADIFDIDVRDFFATEINGFKIFYKETKKDVEKEIFKNDFDINLLEPRVMEYINSIKDMLKNTFPGIKFNNALIIQNIIIDRMARQSAKENAHMDNPNSLMYEFSINDDTLMTGKDLYNFLYDLYYQHYEHERKEILGKKVNKILSAKDNAELSDNEILVIKEYYKDFTISNIPKQFIKYFNETTSQTKE